MAITTSLERQPTNFDYARPTQFRFSLLKIPNTQYFITEINLPGIAFGGDAILNSRYKSMPFMGDTLDFSPVEITFIVQEDLSNYIEIHDWMTGIGFPNDTDQFKNAIASEETKPQTRGSGYAVNPSVLASDGTLTILTNKNNPVARVEFTAMYPTSLSGLQFDTKDTGGEALTATVTMNYDLYKITKI